MDITREEILATIPADETSDPARLITDPLISVLVLAYNHELFFSQALDSIMEQKGDATFEVLIGEDKSTDGTISLCREYQRKHPVKIRLVTSAGNVGLQRNLLRLWGRARGRYIAICEGDDYWTDPFKLHKQFHFMEAHPVYAFCGARSRNKSISECGVKPSYDLEDVLSSYVFHTSTVFCKSRFPATFPREFLDVRACDSFLYVLLAHYGPAGFQDEFMSYYRHHEGGAWSGLTNAARYREIVKFTDTLDTLYGGKYRKKLLMRELRLTCALTDSAVDQGTRAAYQDAASLAARAYPRFAGVQPLRATAWRLGVWCLPLRGAYRHLRRRMALRSRLRKAMGAFSG